MAPPVRPFYFMGHYQSWWKARIDTLDRILTTEFFKGKTVLDMGAGYGTFSHLMQERGATVTASEGREEYIEVIKSRFGEAISTCIEDYDADEYSPVNHDVICHFGVMQYLQNVGAHIAKLVGKSKYLFIECDVIDSNDPELLYTNIQQTGYDQSLNGIGSQFSPAYLERILAENGFTFICLKKGSLDTMVHRYCWQIKNTNKLAPGQGRFWICAQKGNSLDNILSKLYNTNLRPFFDKIPREVKDVIYDTVINYDYLALSIAQRQPRINVYVTEEQKDDALDKLTAAEYIIVDKPHKSVAIDGMISIIAVHNSDNSSRDDTTFVIQGIDTGLLTEINRAICFVYGSIIDATWNKEELDAVKHEVTHKRYYNKQNVYMHALGTLKGLERVETRFAVKVRADEYYTNIKVVLDQLRESPDKIISNNIFARTTQNFPYHISDHLIAGLTENMLIMFRDSIESIRSAMPAPAMKYFVAEQRFTMCYLANKLGLKVADLPTKDFDQIRSYMRQYFIILSVKKLGAFHVSANSMAQKSFTNNSTAREYRYFVNVEDIGCI